MTVQITDSSSNKANGLVILKNMKPVKLWKKLEMTEWTFSLFLFVFSLSVLLGKLCIKYGDTLQQQSHIKYPTPTVAVFSNMSTIFSIPSMADFSEFSAKRLSVTSEKLVNISGQYEDILANAVISFSERCGWLIRATFCGLIMMGFTWLIIYKDSIIPGVNPPSPFSPSKQRLPESPKMQINYFIGVLNGILIFLYMCL